MLFRLIPAVIALGVLPLANVWSANATSADAAPSTQTSSGTIIWDANPAPATRGPNGTIIWNDAGTPNTPRADAAPDKNGITWNSSAPSSRSKRAARPATAADDSGPCREFQTHIIIDGKSEPAHGTACRQPDGTWRVVNR